jgi:hypothetical protein
MLLPELLLTRLSQSGQQWHMAGCKSVIKNCLISSFTSVPVLGTASMGQERSHCHSVSLSAVVLVHSGGLLPAALLHGDAGPVTRRARQVSGAAAARRAGHRRGSPGASNFNPETPQFEAMTRPMVSPCTPPLT